MRISDLLMPLDDLNDGVLWTVYGTVLFHEGHSIFVMAETFVAYPDPI